MKRTPVTLLDVVAGVFAVMALIAALVGVSNWFFLAVVAALALLVPRLKSL